MSVNPAIDKSFDEFSVGDTASFEREILETDLSLFAALSGDYNPLHTDSAYAAQTPFAKPVVFGMLLGSFVSQLIGMQLPGKRALILKETLEFKKPVFVGSKVVVKGEIISKSKLANLIEVKIIITVLEEVVTEGSVHVRIR